MVRKRKFGGKIFKFVGEFSKKSRALASKKRATDAGIPVRVVKTKRGYSVWAKV